MRNRNIVFLLIAVALVAVLGLANRKAQQTETYLSEIDPLTSKVESLNAQLEKAISGFYGPSREPGFDMPACKENFDSLLQDFADTNAQIQDLPVPEHLMEHHLLVRRLLEAKESYAEASVNWCYAIFELWEYADKAERGEASKEEVQQRLRAVDTFSKEQHSIAEKLGSYNAAVKLSRRVIEMNLGSNRGV